jgi:hypothetical protein
MELAAILDFNLVSVLQQVMLFKCLFVQVLLALECGTLYEYKVEYFIC